MSRWHKAKPLSQKIRKRIYRRDKFRCVICHSRIDLEIDHILPISRGGSADDEKNLQLLCRDHHLRKTEKETAQRDPLHDERKEWDVFLERM